MHNQAKAKQQGDSLHEGEFSNTKYNRHVTNRNFLVDKTKSLYYYYAFSF